MAQSFTYVGGEQTYNIFNDGFYMIQVWGASGEDRATGGKADGGYTTGVFFLQTSDVALKVFPGQAGGLSNTGQGGDGHGRVNGGDGLIAPGNGGGGGGAGSYVTIGAFTTLENCLVISGGGGGTAGAGSLTFGGRGGGSVGENGRARPGPSSPTSNDGKPASGTAVGVGGIGAVANGQPGNVGFGGNAGFDIALTVSGGGGGGGYRGGGGAGVEIVEGNFCGGGGGGNGYLNEALLFPGSGINVNSNQVGYVQNPNINGLQTGNGYVTITPVQEVCIAENSKVKLFSAGEVMIQHLRPGQLVVDHRGQAVEIEKVIAFHIPSRNFVRIGRGSLAKAQPSSDLLIRPGHPILVAGRECCPENLVGQVPNIQIVDLDEPMHYYTIITNQRSFVNIQNVSVATWSLGSWNAYQFDRQTVCPHTELC